MPTSVIAAQLQCMPRRRDLRCVRLSLPVAPYEAPVELAAAVAPPRATRAHADPRSLRARRHSSDGSFLARRLGAVCARTILGLFSSSNCRRSRRLLMVSPWLHGERRAATATATRAHQQPRGATLADGRGGNNRGRPRRAGERTRNSASSALRRTWSRHYRPHFSRFLPARASCLTARGLASPRSSCSSSAPSPPQTSRQARSGRA